jgi:hypothetical protein
MVAVVMQYLQLLITIPLNNEFDKDEARHDESVQACQRGSSVVTKRAHCLLLPFSRPSDQGLEP